MSSSSPAEAERKRELLNQLLENDPVRFAADFQLSPALQNALNFTDLRGLSRGTVMEQVVHQFQTSLLDKIPILDVPTRLKLLESSLSSLSHPVLRVVPLLLLDTHPVDLPMEYYTQVLPQLPPEVQEQLPDKVRRRCWELSPELGFKTLVDSAIALYRNDKLVKLANESFDMLVKRRRDKIEALGFLKQMLADSKLLLRHFQSQVLGLMFAQPQQVETLCGLYFDVLMVTGPQDRSSLQDVPYLLEVIKLLEPLEPFPLHPDSITESQQMRLERLDGSIQTLYREFAKHLAAPKLPSCSHMVLTPTSLHRIVVKLLDRFSKKQLKLYKVFYPKVIEDFPELRDRYLLVVDHKPMDLKTMSEKDYFGLDDILDDLQLIYKNCCLFNHTNAEMCASAQRFFKIATEYVHEFRAEEEQEQQQQQQGGSVISPTITTTNMEQVDVDAPQEISQACLDCFVAIGDPLFARKLARLCWELVYFASFNRGKLPRDIPSLRIAAYFLSLSKNQDLLHDISDAFINKTKLALPKLEDEFVTHFVTRDLVKFQTLLLLREQTLTATEGSNEDRVLTESFLDPTCASAELYWRFLLDVGENGKERNEFLRLYDFLLETSPPPAMIKGLIRKKTNSLAVQDRMMSRYFLPQVKNQMDDYRVWELLSNLFALVASSVEERGDGDEVVVKWSDYLRQALQGVSVEMYTSKQFRRARTGFEDFLKHSSFAFLRAELGLPPPQQ
ncbi:hypothetical protein BASA81_010372 [Batrachochytrium salamandrivorans]|nr:hypothetical protein BASA81_010372 [Batrachochytrium salamandrivorans]